MLLVALIAGCEILPIDEIDRCGGSHPPEDCSCADNEAEMDMDLGVRSASCPECLQSPRHPDCANEQPSMAAGAGAGGTRAGSSDGGAASGALVAGRGGAPASGRGGSGSAGRDTSGSGGAAGADPCASCPDGQRCVDRACAECGEDAHCTVGSRRRCDLETRTCVECLRHADCHEANAGQCLEGRCVPCRSSAQCAGVEGRPYCIAADGMCVECRRHGDCQAEDAPQCEKGACVPCTADAACAGRPGRTVCDDGGNSQTHGRCVECTGTKVAPCRRDNRNYVCISRERTCSRTQVVGAQSACEPCVSDAHCADPGLCMPMSFGDSGELGTFCLEPESEHGGDCTTYRRFVSTANGATSVDGVRADVCKPTLTTCQGFNDYGTDCSGTGEEGDAECGAEGVDDGICRPYGPVFRCSYPCDATEQCAARCEPLQSGGRTSCTFP